MWLPSESDLWSTNNLQTWTSFSFYFVFFSMLRYGRREEVKSEKRKCSSCSLKTSYSAPFPLSECERNFQLTKIEGKRKRWQSTSHWRPSSSLFMLDWWGKNIELLYVWDGRQFRWFGPKTWVQVKEQRAFGQLPKTARRHTYNEKEARRRLTETAFSNLGTHQDNQSIFLPQPNKICTKFQGLWIKNTYTLFVQ